MAARSSEAPMAFLNWVREAERANGARDGHRPRMYASEIKFALFAGGPCTGLCFWRDRVTQQDWPLSGQEHRRVTALDRIQSEDVTRLVKGEDAVLGI